MKKKKEPLQMCFKMLQAKTNKIRGRTQFKKYFTTKFHAVENALKCQGQKRFCCVLVLGLAGREKMRKTTSKTISGVQGQRAYRFSNQLNTTWNFQFKI